MTCTPAWPPEVPSDVERDGFTFDREDNRIEFKPQTGRPQRRRRATRSDTLMPCRMKYLNDEWDALDAFSADTLKDGVLAFIREHPLSGVPTLCVFEKVPRIAQLWPLLKQAEFTLRAIRPAPALSSSSYHGASSPLPASLGKA